MTQHSATATINASFDVNRFKIENYRLKAKIERLTKEQECDRFQIKKLQEQVDRFVHERNDILRQHSEMVQELKGRRSEFVEAKELALSLYKEAVTVLAAKRDQQV